jgi:integrase
VLGKLRQCSRAAVIEGIISRDFTLGVKVPAGETRRLTIPSASDVDRLLEAADPTMAIAVLLGAKVGLRQAEMLGLTADRVSWMRDHSVTVDRQATRRTRSAPMTWGPPKSPSSNRTVPVPEDLVLDLAALVEARGGPGDDGLLVHTAGHGWARWQIDKEWRRLRSRVGLDHVRYHDLRHHFCSTLLSAGVNVVAVARIAGHSSPSITLDVYGHVMGDDHDRIRAALRRTEDSVRTARLVEHPGGGL